MLFITSRIPEQGSTKIYSKQRKISFDPQNTDVSSRIYFCERNGKDDYTEIGSATLFERLKELDKDPEKPFRETQVLFYIHGFNNLPESDIFPGAELLEARINNSPYGKLCTVIPVIWPCDDDSALAFMDDYWDDGKASTATGIVLSRLLEKFDNWRKGTGEYASRAKPKTGKRQSLATNGLTF